MFQVSLGYLQVGINSAIITTMRQLTEPDVRSLATEQSFQRGEEYYASEAVREIQQQGETITARVRGSRVDAYRVTITLGPNGISNTRCSCPYDWGGICKHIVATLLTLVRNPDTVESRPPLDDLLAQRSKQDLIILVKEMIASQPDLARLLDLPLHPDSPIPLDLAKFEKQVDYALSREDAERAGRELERLSEVADRYLDTGDSTTAGKLYHLILGKGLVHFESWWSEWDSDGDISLAFSECAAGLGQCLERVAHTETRQPWLEVLLEAYLEDIRQGGIDFFWPAGGLVLEQATDEEWRWIESQVCQEMDRREHWGHAALVGFLTSRLEMAGQENEADAFILAHGTSEQQAYLLLKLDRIEEAVEIARQHFAGRPGLVLDFANRLEIVSQPRAWLSAETLVRVAQAAEATHPRAALEIYRSQAEQAIRGKNRASYVLAAESLGRVQELHRRLGEGIWQAYVTRLREEHRRLRALKEELDRARL
jgi:uncharacterized Zn finger protein